MTGHTRLIKRWLWLIAWLLFGGFSVPGYTADTLPELDISDLNTLVLRAPVEFLAGYPVTDPSELPLEQFRTFTPKDINQGITQQTFWLRARLLNHSAAFVDWYLFTETSYLDNLVVYTRDADNDHFQRTHLSDRRPFHDRPVDYRRLTVQHQTPAHSYTDVYIQVYYDQPDSISLYYQLMSEEAFHKKVREENLLFGAYFGIMVILFFIALVFAMLLRNASALIYVLFLFFTTVKWLAINGFGFQYIWPNAVAWHNQGFHILYLLFTICGLQFSKVFLKTHKYFTGIHTWLTLLQAAAFMAIGLRLFGVYVPVLHFSFFMVIVLAIITPLISWMAWRHGLYYARWYLFAWLMYSLGLLIAVIGAYSNVLPWGMRPLSYLQLGSLLEAIFLTLAMSERLLNLDNDRRRAIELAHQDPLTGLGNRRLLQLQYEKFREQHATDAVPVYLIMIDLDHFKQINDSYGHDAGDTILKQVAGLLRNHCRASDVCIRYGGEEFAVLLHAESTTQAWQIAERIRTSFASTPTPYNDQSIEHTLSIGITPVLSGEGMLTVREMMARADAALYQSKAAGRNRAIVYEQEE